MIYKIGAILVFIGIITGYYFFTQNKIGHLNQELTKSEIIIAQTQAIASHLEEQRIAQSKQINKLIQDLNTAQAYRDKLQKILQKHNLTDLSLKKPQLIEKRINNASKKLFDDIGDITN